MVMVSPVHVWRVLKTNQSPMDAAKTRPRQNSTMANSTMATPAFSLTFGEEHKHPLTITRSDIHFEAIPSQRLCLITLRLTVVNDAIAQDIEGALRFPLPDSDATICGFQLGEDTAVSLPKTKAAEVSRAPPFLPRTCPGRG